MHTVSQAYKQNIKNPLRNRGYMKIFVGDVPVSFQGKFDISCKKNTESEYDTDITRLFTDYSTEDIAYKSITERDDYLTLERLHTQVDGSMRFPPYDESDFRLRRGLTSKKTLDDEPLSIRLSSADWGPGAIKGLTIVFGGNSYPKSFLLSVNGGGYIRTNTEKVFTIDTWINMDVPIQTIDLVFYEMTESDTRLRIESINLGHGVLFDNNEIIDTNFESTIDSESMQLPQINFTAQLKNHPGFDFSYLDLGRLVWLYYGYQLPDTTIEWIRYPVLVLSEIEVSKRLIELTASDFTVNWGNSFCYDTPAKGGVTFGQLMTSTLSEWVGHNRFEYDLITTDTIPELSDICYNPIEPMTSKAAHQCVLNYLNCLETIDILTNAEDAYNYICWQVKLKLRKPALVDFTIEENDMTSEPVKKRCTDLKRLVTNYTTYTDGDPDQIGTEIVQYKDAVTLNELLYFQTDTLYKRITATSDNNCMSVYIKEGYILEAIASAASLAPNLYVYGHEPYKVTKGRYVLPLNEEKDEEKIWDNCLIDSRSRAKALAESLSQYFKENLEYEYDTRGFPELEVGDIINQEIENETIKVRIIELSIGFNGAFYGRMKVRRIVEEEV